MVTVKKAESNAYENKLPPDGFILGLNRNLSLNDLATGSYTWTSSDPRVVATSQDGRLKSLSLGSAVITGTLGGSRAKSAVVGDEISVKVTIVPKKRAVSKITLSDEALTLSKGETKPLTAQISPENPDDPTVMWYSDDVSVCVVDGNGNVAAVGAGETIVTAVASSGVKAQAEVTVSGEGPTPDLIPAESIAIRSAARTQKVGEGLALELEVYPSGAQTGVVSWTSDKPEIAAVDSNGIVTAVAEGEAAVTAQTDQGLMASCVVHVVSADEPDQTITLSVDFLAVAKGKKLALNDLTGFRGKWTVDDAKVAQVDAAGVLKAVAEGETTLTFTVGEVADKNASFMSKSLVAGERVGVKLIVVGKGLAVKKLAISGKPLVAVGGKTAFVAKVTPKKAVYKDVFWRSSDTKVAVVDESGVVTGVANGTATITAIATSGVSKSVTVAVRDKITKITLNTSKATVKVGKTLPLSVKSCLPEGLPTPELVWSSGKESVATVDPATGVVTAVKKGKTVITALDPVTGVKATCRITVKKA